MLMPLHHFHKVQHSIVGPFFVQFSVFHIDVRDLEHTVCFQRLVWSSDTKPPFRIWPQPRSVKFFSNHRFPSRTWSEQETMLQRTEQLRSCELFLGGWDRQNVIIYANVVLGHRFCLTFQSHFTIYKGCTGQHPSQSVWQIHGQGQQ